MTHELGTKHDDSLVKEREEEANARLDHPRPQEKRKHHHHYVVHTNHHERCEEKPAETPDKLCQHLQSFGEIIHERTEQIAEGLHVR